MSTQPRLTPAQEAQRLDGLRALARVIVRHYLAHPELYPATTGGVVTRAGGNADHKEAAE